MAGPVVWYSPDNHTCSFVSRPFIEAVGRNQTPARSDWIAEGRCSCDRLRSCIDRPQSDARISGPRRNQAPSHQCQLAEVWSLANDRNNLSRRDVVARLPVILKGNCVEVLGDDLLTAR